MKRTCARKLLLGFGGALLNTGEELQQLRSVLEALETLQFL